MRIRSLSLLALPLLLAFGPGCQEEEQPIAERSMFEGRTAQQPQQVPSQQPQGQQPQGRAPGGAMGMAAPAGSGTGRNALEWTVPEGWETRTPANRMRRAEYGIPGEAGEAELAVYYFGPGQGGSPRDNAVRWARQFEIPGGGDPVAAMETSTAQVNGRDVMTVEVAGTYKGGGGPMMGGASQPEPGYKLLGAVVEGPDAPWFFKLTGPEKTVEAARPGFEKMLESVHPGQQ